MFPHRSHEEFLTTLDGMIEEAHDFLHARMAEDGHPNKGETFARLLSGVIATIEHIMGGADSAYTFTLGMDFAVHYPDLAAELSVLMEAEVLKSAERMGFNVHVPPGTDLTFNGPQYLVDGILEVLEDYDAEGVRIDKVKNDEFTRWLETQFDPLPMRAEREAPSDPLP